MDFIFIQALWLLPIASLPIIFNIINNRKFKIVDFSTIRFIESLKADSIKKINIINLLLLILRILIVLLLILTISRPVIKSSSESLLNNASSTRAVILIDDSYSNFNKDIYRYQSKKIDAILREIVEEYKNATSIEISSINQGVLYSGLARDLDLDRLIIPSSYKNGSMWNLMDSYFSTEASDSYLNGDMYVITDMDRSSFSGINQEYWWNVAFININSKFKEPTVSEITLSKKIIFPNQEFDVSVKIINNSNIKYLDKDDLITAHLYINNNISIPQSFGIDSNSTREIAFRGVTQIGDGALSVELRKGQEEFGERVFAKANISPNIKLGFLNIEDVDTKIFLSKASESIKKDRIDIGEAFLNYSNLIGYDILVIDRLEHLENPDLVKYLVEGGHLLVLPINMDTESYSILLKGERIALEYQSRNHLVEKEDILDFALSSEVFEKNNENILFELKDFYSLPLNSNSIIKTTNRSLWNRYHIGEGIVDFFGFNLNIEDNDFSIKASFIPFVHSLLISNKSKELEVKISDNLIDNIFPSKRLFPLALKKDSILVDRFDFYTQKIDLSRIESPGFYQLVSESDQNKIIKSYIANIDPLEAEYKEIGSHMIDSLFNANMYKYDARNGDLGDLGGIISKKIKGVEIWHIFLLGAILLFILESIIVSIYQRRF